MSDSVRDESIVQRDQSGSASTGKEHGILRKVRDHYRWAASWKTSAGLSAILGWEFVNLMVKLGRPEPTVWRVRPRQVRYPLKMRLRGSSDLDVFQQIFVSEEYACLLDLKEPSLVLDLGANVGFSSAFFLNVFPYARVVALEPDERNHLLGKANLLPYGDRALILCGAVWSKPSTLQLVRGVFGDGREWATKVEELAEGEVSSGGVRAWDVGSLIDMGGGGPVDLLKVDIEGAELSVFGESAALWLDRVRNICIELHGRDCEETFFAAIKDFDYELQHSGELTICRGLRRKSSKNAVSAMREVPTWMNDSEPVRKR